MWGLAGGSGGLTSPALALYGHLEQKSSIYDVTEGGDGFCGGDSPATCRPLRDIRHGGLRRHYRLQWRSRPRRPLGVGTPSGLGLFKPLLPHAAIAPEEPVLAGTSVAFSAAGSSDPYPGGSLSSYEWSWGDGTPDSTGAAPRTNSKRPANTTVTLTVIDSYGVTSTPATLQFSAYGNAKKSNCQEAGSRSGSQRKEEEAATRRKKKKRPPRGAKKKRPPRKSRKKRSGPKKKLCANGSHRPGRRRSPEDLSPGREVAEQRSAEEARAREGSSPPVTSEARPFGGANTSRYRPPSWWTSPCGRPLRRGAPAISCPVGETRCIGIVTLRTAGPSRDPAARRSSRSQAPASRSPAVRPRRSWHTCPARRWRCSRACTRSSSASGSPRAIPRAWPTPGTRWPRSAVTAPAASARVDTSRRERAGMGRDCS